MFAPTSNLPTNPKSANEPGSPASLGYASSDHDHASAGSGFFSRTSSGTSHSSHPDDPATEDLVDSRAASPFSETSAISAESASSCHASVVSGKRTSLPYVTMLSPMRGATHDFFPEVGVGADRSSPHPSPHVSPSSSISPTSPTPHNSSSAVAVFTQQTQSELDILKARGETIPEHIFALRSDTTVEMLRLATDIQKHIAGVEEKVNGHGDRFKTIEVHLGEVQHSVDGFKRTVEQRFDTILDAINRSAGDKSHDVAGSGESGPADGGVQTLLKQSLEGYAKEYAKESAKLLQQHLDASAKAMEQRLDESAEKRFSAFREEMSKNYAQLKEDIGDQIREELGGEQRKYDSTLALQAFAEDAVETTHDAIVRQVGQLSQVVQELQKHIPSTSAASASADHAPAAGASASASTSTTPSTSLAPTAPNDGQQTPQIGGARPLLEALTREVMRIAAKLRRDLGKR